MLRNISPDALKTPQSLIEKGKGYGVILPHRDAIPIQLVIVPKLSKEHNYWLNNLRNDLKAGSEIKNFIESYSKNKNSKTISGTRRRSHACKLGKVEGGIEYV